jgi:hypothetical protein
MRTVRLSLLAATIALTACTEQPEREVSAVVVSIAPHENPKWNPDEVVVTARTADGAFGSKSVLVARLKCRVGDTVHGSAQGISLTLDDQVCER